MFLGYIIIRSPYTPYSIYLRGTVCIYIYIYIHICEGDYIRVPYHVPEKLENYTLGTFLGAYTYTGCVETIPKGPGTQ